MQKLFKEVSERAICEGTYLPYCFTVYQYWHMMVSIKSRSETAARVARWLLKFEWLIKPRLIIRLLLLV